MNVLEAWRGLTPRQRRVVYDMLNEAGNEASHEAASRNRSPEANKASMDDSRAFRRAESLLRTSGHLALRRGINRGQ